MPFIEQNKYVRNPDNHNNPHVIKLIHNDQKTKVVLEMIIQSSVYGIIRLTNADTNDTPGSPGQITVNV